MLGIITKLLHCKLQTATESMELMNTRFACNVKRRLSMKESISWISNVTLHAVTPLEWMIWIGSKINLLHRRSLKSFWQNETFFLTNPPDCLAPSECRYSNDRLRNRLQCWWSSKTLATEVFREKNTKPTICWIRTATADSPVSLV